MIFFFSIFWPPKHKIRPWPQMHHIIHARVTPTVPYLQEPSVPFQDSSIETTEFGITQQIPARQNRKAHRSEAIGQYRNKWLTLSPADLHKQHQSAITIANSNSLSSLSLFSIVHSLNLFWLFLICFQTHSPTPPP